MKKPKKVLVVYKKSIFQIYDSFGNNNIDRFLYGGNEDAVRMKESAHVQDNSLLTVFRILDKLNIKYDKCYRANLKDWDLDDYDLIITVGGDGTFMEVSHYVNSDTPILAVNSDPNSSAGFYCCCDVNDFELFLNNISDMNANVFHRLKLSINGIELKEQAINDILFAHKNPAATTRYRMYDNKYHKNSGLIACTPSGSTAWMWEENGELMPADVEVIQYIHRGERHSVPQFICNNLILYSLTRSGKIYIDGPHLSYDLTMGDSLSIERGDPLIVYGDIESKRIIWYINKV